MEEGNHGNRLRFDTIRIVYNDPILFFSSARLGSRLVQETIPERPHTAESGTRSDPDQLLSADAGRLVERYIQRPTSQLSASEAEDR